MRITSAVLAVLVLTIPCQAATIYVNEGSAGTGSSWADAYGSLQDALDAAVAGNSIFVGQGTYVPDTAGLADPREATFQMKNGVTIEGGYAGYGTADPDERNVELYETILSGDLAGDDGPGFDNNDENSYHVVTGSGTDETAVLDGFTITVGNANGSNPYNKGGGMLNESGSPTLTNCTFTGNLANDYGGGMTNWNNSSPTLTNCTFTDNSAEYYSGGGMANYQSSPTVTNCTFNGNSAYYYGGGGMYNVESSPTVTNCTFIGNSAGWDGGGMINWESSTKVTNCTFTGNSAGWDGGGMYNHASSPELVNCTFSGNSAGEVGGGMGRNESNNRPIVTNCILWGNEAPYRPEIYGSASVSYSDVQGGWPGEGNINMDPLFVDANNDDLHLLPYSPCIDAGDNSVVEPNSTDLDGNPRIIDGDGDGEAIVDMGAYESMHAIKVDMKVTPQTLNCRSRGDWVKAHFTLPEGSTVGDVDVDTPALLGPFGFESAYLEVFVNEEELVEVEAAFVREEVCSLAGDWPEVLNVAGFLTNGDVFLGTSTVRIITAGLQEIVELASQWLQGDCVYPDWCDGTDLSRDSVVNFLDYPLMLNSQVEFINE